MVRADIRIVDVAVDDVADDVAADSSAKPYATATTRSQSASRAANSRTDLRRVQTSAGVSALDDALDRGIDPARVDRRHPRSDLRAGRPIVVTRETLASLRRRTCVAISGAVQVARSRT